MIELGDWRSDGCSSDLAEKSVKIGGIENEVGSSQKEITEKTLFCAQFAQFAIFCKLAFDLAAVISY